MKKLLFSLFAIALIFVACDKEAVEEMAPQNLIEEAQNINANVDLDLSRLEQTLERISTNSKSYDLKDESASRTAGGSIRILGGAQGVLYYEFLFSDDVDVCNEGDYSYLNEDIYLTLNSSNHTEVRVGAVDAAIVATITRDFSNIFGLSIKEGISFDFGSNAVVVGTLANDGIITIGSSAFNFVCAGSTINPADYYDVLPAPFPLTGFLARITDTSFTGNSLNYAASTREAVVSAINADIMDGN